MLRRPILAPLLALALVACGEEREEFRARFDWPATARASVREARTAGGHTDVVTYDWVVEPAEEGGLLVRTEGFEFESLAGVPADDPEVAAQAEAAERIAGFLPPFRVDEDGAFLGMTGFDRYLEQVTLGLSEGDAAEAERFRAFLESFRVGSGPSARDQLQQALVGRWNEVAGHWTGFDVPIGELESGTQPWPLQFAEVGSVPLEFERGALEVAERGGRDAIRLVFRGTVEGPEFVDAMQRMTEALLANAGRDAGGERIVEGRITVDWEGWFDRDTMQPIEVATRTGNRYLIAIGDAEPRESAREETRRYEFAWE